MGRGSFAQRCADRGVDGRSEVEFGQRRPQIEARAADDDRAAALFEQLVDRRVRSPA